MSSLYTNIDGLTQRYGNERIPAAGYTRKLSTFGVLNELVVDFDFATLEVFDEGDVQSATMDRFSELMAYIPAGAAIITAHILPIEDFDEDIDVGTYEKDGTEIDDDGLVDGVTPEVATGLVVGAGAQIGDVMADDAYIVIAASDVGSPPTEGKARLVVYYIK